ncbi:hypothetical protein [Dolichospermum phage Dfl-JY45]
MTSAPRTPPAAPSRGEPREGALVDQLIALLRGLLIDMGVKHIAPPNGVLDEDGDFDMPIDFALIPNQLLPILVQQARMVYAEAWLDRGGSRPFTFENVPDMGGLMRQRVVAAPKGVAFEIAALCVTDALLEFAKRNPPSRGVLMLG